MDEDVIRKRSLYRLAWKWRESGVSGSGPWTHRGEVVEGWLASMSERHGESVHHWIERAELDVRPRPRRNRG